MNTNVTLHMEDGYVEYRNLRSALADGRHLAIRGNHASVIMITTWNLTDIIEGYGSSLSSQKKHWVKYALCNREGDVVCNAQSKYQAFDFALQSYRKSVDCRIFKIIETKRYGNSLLTCDKWNEAQSHVKVMNQLKAVYKILQAGPELGKLHVLAIRDISNACKVIMRDHRVPLDTGINEYKAKPKNQINHETVFSQIMRNWGVNNNQVSDDGQKYVAKISMDGMKYLNVSVPKYEGMEPHLIKALYAIADHIKNQ